MSHCDNLPEDAIESIFNTQWYVSTNADVAKAGVDPWQHYWQFGRFEGRWPAALEAVCLDTKLWAGDTECVKALEALIEKPSDDILACANWQLAHWFLARWYAFNQQPERVLSYLSYLLSGSKRLALLRSMVPQPGPFLCLFNALCETDTHAAERLLSSDDWLTRSASEVNDKRLARAMLYRGQQRLDAVNTLYSNASLGRLVCPSSTVTLDNLSGVGAAPAPKLWQRRPLVSVIVPCYNCADTVKVAIDSLLNQSWRKLEVLLVDDASTDATLECLQRMAARDARIRVISLPSNEGAYGARNAGLEASRGKLITTHDADDWSHPDKIARQVYDLLKHPEAIANRSSWIRTDAYLRITPWRSEHNWIYPNVSSLMFRRKARKAIGFWDTVSADGDTEFYYRICERFGEGRVRHVLPHIPLAFGRVQRDSLTQQKATHLQSKFGGVRAVYQAAAHSWHKSGASLYLERQPTIRPFKAPLSLCRGGTRACQSNQRMNVEASGYFDADYYLSRYPDIADAAIGPVEHYLRFGAREGRDPSAQFSSTGYAYLNASDDQNDNPLVQFLTQREQREEIIEKLGEVDPKSGRPVLMVFGHSAAGQVFGAEKSLLDTLRMLTQHYQLWVVLPAAENRAYVDTVASIADCVTFLPIRWWSPHRELDRPIVDRLIEWLTESSAVAVYVNTLTLYEPFIAANDSNLPAVVHVRELPSADPALCKALAASPQAIRQHVVNNSDKLIANSRCVADYLAEPNKTYVVPNVVDVERFAEAHRALPKTRWRVGMLSSNLAKKGIEDFLQLAESLHNDSQFEWCLYGPITDDLVLAQKRYSKASVDIRGYIDSPLEALKELDIVLNLSHFQESFGRTVLEGMAAGKLVVAYDWGAIPELLSNETGVLVKKGDVVSIKEALLNLKQMPEQITQKQMRAIKAAGSYRPSEIKSQLLAVLKE